MSSSRKSAAVISGSPATQPGIRDGNGAVIQQESPLKNCFLQDLENLPPLSPDLVLSVPETPQSQIRLDSSLSSRDPGQEGCKSSLEAGLLERLGQMSPICRSPTSKVRDVRRTMTASGQKPKRGLEYSCSVKRVLSPPQDSHSVKRSRGGIGGGAGDVSRGGEKRNGIIKTDFGVTLMPKFPQEKDCGLPDATSRAEQRDTQQDETDPDNSESGKTSHQGAAGGEVEQTKPLLLPRRLSCSDLD